MLNIQSLKYILQVNAIGSINKAAEILFVSQPRLSRMIQEVEDQIGIVIFQRTNKGVVATYDGQIFIDRITKLVADYDSLENLYSVRSNLNEDEISLYVGIERHYPLVFTIMQFYNKHCRDTDKNVNLVLHEGNKDEIMRLVSAGSLDIGNVHFMSDDREEFLSEIEEMSLGYTMLSVCPVCAQVAEDHPLAGEESITLDMLDPYPRIAFLDEDFTGINYCSDIMQYDREKLQKRFVLQERGTHREIIDNTQGYSIGAYYDIDQNTDPNIRMSSVIKCIPISDIDASFNTVLIYRKGHKPSEYELELFNLLANLYGKYFGRGDN